MLVYRLAKEQYIHDLSGTGVRLCGGRWNRKGTPMLYTSQHCSLAVLELLVHTPHTLLPDNMSLLKLYIPDDITLSTLTEDQLPKNWRQYPAPDVLADIGTEWINQKENVGIKVPSVLVQDEWNILLNPTHQNSDNIYEESVSRFSLDSRF